MDAWASEYEGRATFVCVSCAGANLSEAFGNELQLAHCVNSVAEQQPEWGQLGCNGFILLDKDMKVVCRKTAAFLQVRERAFEQVESLLSSLLGKGSVAKVGETHRDSSNESCAGGG